MEQYRRRLPATSGPMLRGLLTLVLILIMLLNPLSIASAQSGDVGYRDFTYPAGAGGNSDVTGEKPESKLWWHDGNWYGVLWSRSGNAYHIYRMDLNTQKWVDTGEAVDDRLATKADALSDGSKLYIVSHIFTENGAAPTAAGQRGELFRYSYQSSSKSYSLDSGFPIEITGGKSESLVIAKDSSGMLWVTYVQSKKVMVTHSQVGNDLSWVTPYVLPVGASATVAADDVSSLISYNQYLGVMWSNQNSPKTMYFAVHESGTSDQTWTSIPAFTASSDDHINLKVLQSDPSGNLFAVIKTSKASQLIVVLVCENNLNRCKSQSDWASYTVYNSTTHNPTRPIMLIDETNRHLYVFTRNEDSNHNQGIYYKRTSLDNISFDTGSMGTPFIKNSVDVQVNDPTSTKQNLTSQTGLLLLASDTDTYYYLHNYLALGNQPPAMTFTGFSPGSGPVGTEVTLTGTNLNQATGVTFNNVAANFTIVSNTKIRAVVPDGATTGSIRVIGPNGTLTSSSSFTVTVLPPPITISGFTPTSGPVGTEVTLTGTGFDQVTGVSFNNKAAASFTIDSGTQIRATVPDGASSGPISVTGPNGVVTSSGSFGVTSPVSILGFTPASGPVGTEVTLTGSNFTGATGVTFNGVPAATFTVDSTTQIRVIVPVGATTGPITVSTPGGSVTSGSSFTVTGGDLKYYLPIIMNESGSDGLDSPGGS